MNKYQKLSVVGKGAFGSVYLYQRLEDKKKLIIKLIPVSGMTNEEKQVSLNEAKVLSMLDHPYIIAHYDNFLDDNSIVIVMEYAPGGTLHDYLRKRNHILLTEEEVLHHFAQMVMAINHVHSRQILHRDLKTHNIFMTEEYDMIKIGDFGISKILTTKSQACSVVGTPSYISPELCEGKSYNQKSDIWALGCVLYELLTLNKAFEADNLPALVVKILRGSFEPVSKHYDSDLRQLLMSMLSVDPVRRPVTPQIMARPCLVKTLYPLYLFTGCVPNTKSDLTPVNSSINQPNFEKGTFNEPITSSMKLLKGTNSYRYRLFQYSDSLEAPLQVTLPTTSTDIASMAIGVSKVFLLNKNGFAFEWRKGTLEGISPCFPQTTLPIQITQVTCGKGFTVILTSQGLVMTYGDGNTGCLGHENKDSSLTPKHVKTLLGMEITQIACGQEHVVAVSKDGSLFTWGNGQNGRLGLGGTSSQLLPKKVPLHCDIIPCHVACSSSTTFLVTKSCQLLATGSNRYNKLGMDDDNGISVDEVKSFTEVTAFKEFKIKAVVCGESHTAVLTDGGQWYTFGSNKFGQLGWGETVGLIHNLPSQIETPDNEVNTLMQVSCGNTFTVALAPSGKIHVWGVFGNSKVLKAHSFGTVTVNPQTTGIFKVLADGNNIIVLAKDNSK